MDFLSVSFICYDPSCYGELVSILADRDTVCNPHPYVSDFRKKFHVNVNFRSEHRFSVHYNYDEPIDVLIGYRVARILLLNVRMITGNKCKFTYIWSK